MIIHNDDPCSLPALRLHLGLPPQRPDGIRDLLAVRRGLGSPVPAPDARRLALDDWPELWAAEPANAPRFLIMLQGTASPYFIATVEDIDPAGWALDGPRPDPQRRVVPVRGTARATASLAGRRLSTDLPSGPGYAFL